MACNYRFPGRMQNSSYYNIASVGDRTHVDSNMAKVSHALNHSATAADRVERS